MTFDPNEPHLRQESLVPGPESGVNGMEPSAPTCSAINSPAWNITDG